MNKLARLWFPFLVFLAFLSALFSSDLLVRELGTNLSVVAQNNFIYGVQTGVWLSAALLLNRLIEVFFWDGFVGTLSGRKVPRLPKDVTALALFVLAGAGYISYSFRTLHHRNPGDLERCLYNHWTGVKKCHFRHVHWIGNPCGTAFQDR